MTKQAMDDGINNHGPESAARGVFRLCWALLIVATVVSAALFLAEVPVPNGERFLRVSFYLTGQQDFPWLFLAVLLWPVLWKLSKTTPRRSSWLAGQGTWIMAICIALLVFGIVLAGTFVVYDDFALSMDEFMMRFQSALVQDGYLLAPVSDEWFQYSQALRPGFLIADQDYQYWAPGYRPGTAFLHAFLGTLRAGQFMNASFCALSVLLVWSLARRLLPDTEGAVFWTVLLFASSAQFLITGMTPYTMTAHLFASLLWLWLFVKDRPLSHLGAIVLGAYALGLHQVHVHATFALPFLIHLFFVRRRVALSLAYGAVYAVAGLGWIFWMDVAEWLMGLTPVERDAAQIDGGADFVAMAVSQGLDGHGFRDLVDWMANLSRLVAWQNLAALPLFILGMRVFRSMPIMLKLVAWSIGTSLLPYILLMPDQGHGWGYRYLHPVMGNFALIGGYGWAFVQSRGWIRMQRFVVVLTAISLLVALPLRAMQTHAFVAPFAQAMASIRGLDADLVILDEGSIWYGVDLVRNDPLLRNRPVVMAASKLELSALERLCRDKTAVFLGWQELQYAGLAKPAEYGGREPGARQSLMDNFHAAGCNGIETGGKDG